MSERAVKAKNTRFHYTVENIIEKPFNWKQMTRLLQYMKPYAKTILPKTMVMMLIATAIRLAIPFLVGFMVIEYALIPGDFTMLAYLAGAVLVLYIISYFANMLRIRWMNELGQHIIFDIRESLFKHIQRLSHRFFDQRSAGSILVRVINDVNSLQDLFTNGVINLIMDIVMLLGIVFILFYLSPELAIFVLIVVPIMFFISTKLRRNIRRAWQYVRVRQSVLNSHLNESIQGIRVTQAYAQEKENMEFFENVNNENFKSWRNATKQNALFRPFVEMASVVGAIVLIWYGSTLIQGGLEVGVFVAFAFYLGMFWEPISRLGQVYNQLLVGMASSERIFEFLDEKPSVPEKANAIPIGDVKGEMVFENVEFSYDDKRKALKGINLTFNAGDTIALVGHTGSGKSTIVNLMSRFYDPTAGRVLLDGNDLKDLKLHELRTNVSYVLQDTFIFAGTILENIRFGKPTATDEEVKAAAEAIGAHTFIERLDKGYETEVEEKGSVLSVGERQLLSFARALLADPKILILDEATASIDTETELKIQQGLKKLLHNRTAVMIAHRLSTIRDSDKIIVLDHGDVMEQGTHNELMDKKGIYYELVKSQYSAIHAD
ncbi:multidrug ABC transporter ATP-binding protein [Alkalihalobacillus alcalophilus ATCC 27647 = CGMCC 1.3604]|uniref:Multidrug ABC transporter ATP-binding protein n=1 Tax=Alkalihalobacillus alcalophilus ATCC 27647 = CGMCC 1.3604 TaxID=1218173 RepID=A0A094WMF0_ALKAL|nr:ABC transporter ATP-binding protein [Alkalihalobacillus alcalophilus]KGA98041.1 multidrug ABC transporter ATP-binding protein [Alkalihalobacillus alcalophilus ATCC 27647 = CGMCC 1.3604]MED1561901.1 ABC transporter ATP-binding protein [Alkalihalobacillus alcalophilus]THG89584.1 multidrug ABC transporter ATP-binding protein [Alkalihalobacillus alcalophilus ATCC 27647 = CGMCC 1.3604]